jgi:hypothetical protein
MTFEPISNQTIIPSHSQGIEDALNYALQNSEYKRIKTLAGTPPITVYFAKHADYRLRGNNSSYRHLYVYTDGKSFINLVERYSVVTGTRYFMHCFACPFLLNWLETCPIFEFAEVEFMDQNVAEKMIREEIPKASAMSLEQKANATAKHNFTFTKEDMINVEKRLRDQMDAFRYSLKNKSLG